MILLGVACVALSAIGLNILILMRIDSRITILGRVVHKWLLSSTTVDGRSTRPGRRRDPRGPGRPVLFLLLGSGLFALRKFGKHPAMAGVASATAAGVIAAVAVIGTPHGGHVAHANAPAHHGPYGPWMDMPPGPLKVATPLSEQSPLLRLLADSTPIKNSATRARAGTVVHVGLPGVADVTVPTPDALAPPAHQGPAEAKASLDVGASLRDDEDQATVDQQADGSADSPTGDTVRLHERVLARERTVRDKLPAPDPVLKEVSELPVGR